jgi:transcription antitermination factor NusG
MGTASAPNLGGRVRIVDGPFAGNRGEVAAVDAANRAVEVLVSFFGRQTQARTDVLNVARAS